MLVCKIGSYLEVYIWMANSSSELDNGWLDGIGVGNGNIQPKLTPFIRSARLSQNDGDPFHEIFIAFWFKNQEGWRWWERLRIHPFLRQSFQHHQIKKKEFVGNVKTPKKEFY